MILIADSGGTKTEWMLLKDDGSHQTFKGSGINLNAQPEALVLATLHAELPFERTTVKTVHFYGAGLGTQPNVEAMVSLLEQCFPWASVHTYHDILGAARAACGHGPGTVCILGTGSNACRYDGKVITAQRGGHGWIIGDEGSGADLGKSLIKAALDNAFSPALVDALVLHAGQPLLDLRSAVYRGDRPNAFLGGLVPFLVEQRGDPEIQQLLRERFQAFLRSTVLHWADAKALHFVGGVAAVFEPELRAACTGSGLEVVKVLRAPGRNLLAWHEGQ